MYLVFLRNVKCIDGKKPGPVSVEEGKQAEKSERSRSTRRDLYEYVGQYS